MTPPGRTARARHELHTGAVADSNRTRRIDTVAEAGTGAATRACENPATRARSADHQGRMASLPPFLRVRAETQGPPLWWRRGRGGMEGGAWRRRR
jgi:hypothetical protein